MGASLLAASVANASAAEKHLAPIEDLIFDAHRIPPAELLLNAYNEHPLLFIATSNHRNYQAQLYLADLLKSVGTDPRLKFVVLERPHDNASFYAMLSKTELSEAIARQPFSSESSRIHSMCASPEWAYSISDLFPLIREINRKRPATNPLIVTSVDGVHSEHSLSWPGWGGMLRDGSCHLDPLFGAYMPTIYAMSGNREITTSYNFESQIWNHLGAEDKVIVLYHHAHLLDGFESCFPFMESETSWVANATRLSWLSHFWSRHSASDRSRASLILLDEADGSYSPDGAFRFVSRQAKRFPGVDFGVPLAPFKGVVSEAGLSAFNASAFLVKYHGGKHSSALTFAEMADGVIWTHDAQIKRQLEANSHAYLPDQCTEADGGEQFLRSALGP